MSSYGYEVSRAKRSNRPVRGASPSSDKRSNRDVKVGGRRPVTILTQPEMGCFTCGDTRLLVAYHYLKRSVRGLSVQQQVFLCEIETHVVVVGSKPDDGCACGKILTLIDRYIELWWRQEGLDVGERVSTLDSDRINNDEIDLIACTVDGW